MARKKKSKSAPGSTKKSAGSSPGRKKIGEPKTPGPLARWWYGLDEPARRRVRTRALWALLLALSVAPMLWGLEQMQQIVLADRRTTRDFQVRLDSPPHWLPADVITQLQNEMTPPEAQFHDEDLARRIFQLAQENPWIRRVRRVRKDLGDLSSPGQVRVLAEYRSPFAVVVDVDDRGERPHRFVDADGVVLPTHQTPVAMMPDAGPDGRNVYFTQQAMPPYDPRVRRLSYVYLYNASGDPGAVGQAWPGKDLRDGLRLADLIMKLPWWTRYHWQIELGGYDRKGNLSMRAIDAAGRETYIEFGHFPRIKGDWKLSPEKKMQHLNRIYRELDEKLTHKSEIDLRMPVPDVR